MIHFTINLKTIFVNLGHDRQQQLLYSVIILVLHHGFILYTLLVLSDWQWQDVHYHWRSRALYRPRHYSSSAVLCLRLLRKGDLMSVFVYCAGIVDWESSRIFVDWPSQRILVDRTYVKDINWLCAVKDIRGFSNVQDICSLSIVIVLIYVDRVSCRIFVHFYYEGGPGWIGGQGGGKMGPCRPLLNGVL